MTAKSICMLDSMFCATWISVPSLNPKYTRRKNIAFLMEHNKEALGKRKNYISQYREPGRNQFRALDYQGSKKERDESRARNKRPNAAAPTVRHTIPLCRF